MELVDISSVTRERAWICLPNMLTKVAGVFSIQSCQLYAYSSIFFQKMKILSLESQQVLRRSVSIFPCLTIVFSSTFIMSISVK
jgi:hypothetical protein